MIHALAPGSFLQGKSFSVGEVLGQGSFGITYHGHDLNLNRSVAIKEFFPRNYVERNGTVVSPTVPPESFDYEAAKGKFIGEAQMLARFHHPNIVQVHAVFEENGTACMVMEHLDGVTLEDMLMREKCLTPEVALPYIQKIGEALESLHNSNLLHRDIKPANIIVTTDGRVVLLDFGTARDFADEKTSWMTAILTPAYAPIEQYWQNAHFGVYTDVYALGATAYHLLTGTTPSQATERAAGLPLISPREKNPGIDSRVSDAIMWAMEMQIADRPRSVHEFMMALNGRIARGDTDTVAPPPEEIALQMAAATGSAPASDSVGSLPAAAVPGEPAASPQVVPPSIPQSNRFLPAAAIAASIAVIAAVSLVLLSGGKKDELPKATGGPPATTAATARSAVALSPAIWAMSRGDAKRSSRSIYAGPAAPKKRWEFSASGGSESAALASNATLYFTNGRSELFSLTTEGKPRWTFRPARSGGTSEQVEEKDLSTPAIADNGVIYFGGLDGNFYAVSPDGKEKWQFTAGGAIHTSPAIAPDGTIYFGSSNGKFFALAPGGKKKWEFAATDSIWSSPAIGDNGNVYFACDDGKLRALSPEGDLLWQFPARAWGLASPAVASDGTIYFGSADRKVYALNIDGTLKWAFAIGQMIRSSPAIAKDGTVYVGSDDGKLYAITPEGNKKWEFATKDQLHSSPSIDSDGTIYLGSLDGTLYAIMPDGSEKWRLEAGAPISAVPAIGRERSLYFGTRAGAFFSVGE